MRSFLRLLPNLLSGIRVVLVPVLWVLALRGEMTAVGVGLLVAGLTDVLDGHLARRLNVATPAGAALDSLGDNLLAPSAALWLLLFRRDVAAYFAVPLAIWGALYAMFLVVGWVRFRRFGNLHLYSSKAAAVVAYAFITACFLLPGTPTLLGWIAAATSIAAVVEGLVCQAVCREIDESVGSIVRVIRRRRTASPDEAGVGRAA
jgi:cardiolipin synthase